MVAVELWNLRTDFEQAIEIVPPHWVDDDEIFALGEHYDLLLFERFSDGTLLVTPPPGFHSGVRNADLVFVIRRWAETAGGGTVSSCNGGLALPDGSLFAPDAAFIAPNRMIPDESEGAYPMLAPDAVFELLSRSDRVRTTMRKMRTYLRNGVRLAVLIDPYNRRVYVGREDDREPRSLGYVDALDCSPVMPGFVLDVAAVTRNARR